jgi:hypothetical protein
MAPRIAAALLVLAGAGPAFAQDGPASPFAPPAVSDDALGKVAGRADTAQAAYADQVAGVSDNSVGDNVRTGNASISDNAFQNLSGLSVLNVNTGNNVAINAAMNVNIAIRPNP